MSPEAVPTPPRTKVLLISHTCMSRTKGQPKAACISRLPGIDLQVLVPDRWNENNKWITPEVPEDSSNNAFGFRVERVSCPWMGPSQTYLHSYPHLARLLREFRPDVIDIWEEPWSLVSAQTCFLRNRLLPKAKIISETEQNINKQLPPPFEQMRSYTLRNADLVIGRSKEAVEVVREKGYNGPAYDVPNGVDTNLFQPTNREAFRRKHHLTGFVAGYIGRLVEEKGLMDMVDALEFCASPVTLLFVGDGPFKADLQLRAEKAGRSSQVLFLPERNLDELPEVMSSLDVFLLASRTTKRWKEQFGRVIIEAQGCCVPVIGSDSGAIPSVIGDGGLTFPERDPKALAARINRLASDPAYRATLGGIGRRQAVEKHSWERVADQMWDIYAEVRQDSMPSLMRPAYSDRGDSPRKRITAPR